ncbi:MAG: ABC-type sugar transport system, permease component [Clostridiales bacterium]|nr:ABC-type sugar transport system, permease component [Clostridiales bacterium]
MKIKQSVPEKMFDVFNYTILILFSLMVILPLMQVIAISFSSNNAIIHSKVWLLPSGFNLENYKHVLQNPKFLNSFMVTVVVVIVGTIINLLLTMITAYPLSKSHLQGRKIILLVLFISMVFQAPLIPLYLLVKNLHLTNTLWALWLPNALSIFNTFLCITFFRSLPEELFEAARVDGLGELGILFKIALPISKPIMFTLLLFYAAGHWNNYQQAMYFITKEKIQPLQLYLYSLVAQSNSADTAGAVIAESATNMSSEGIKTATIIIATLPILFVYPFIQKHFVKGAMIGSVKG